MKRLLAVGMILTMGACAGPGPDGEEGASAAGETMLVDMPQSPSGTASSDAPAMAMSQILAAENATGGTLGLAAVHLPSGQRIGHNVAERFPMASTFKLALALAVLARVDSGSVRLDDRVELMPSDFRLGPSPIADTVGPRGGTATVRQMVWLMLYASDNTSTDRLMRMIGGPAAVDVHLRARGIDGMRVDRYEGDIHWQYAGVRDVPPEREWTLERFRTLTTAVPRARKDSAHAAFYADPRDTATPEAFVALLAQVARGEGLSSASHRFLLDAMEASTTGARRIRGALPEGTVVADRTGTIGTTTNDVGLITMPDGSQVAIAVLVKGSPRPTEEVEAAIARASRAVYDAFAGTSRGQ